MASRMRMPARIYKDIVICYGQKKKKTQIARAGQTSAPAG